MHPNMKRLLGLDTPVVFHEPTWPTPVHIPYEPKAAPAALKTTEKKEK